LHPFKFRLICAKRRGGRQTPGCEIAAWNPDRITESEGNESRRRGDPRQVDRA
jgi:hypothetical protein